MLNSIVSGMSPAAWGAVFLVAALVFHWLRIFQRTRAILAFAGVCMLGSGLLRSILTGIVRDVSAVTTPLVGKVFGAAVIGLPALVLLIVFVHDLHPRGGGSSKRTMFVGIALAAFLVAGASSIPALNQVPRQVQTGVTSVTGG